MTLRLSKIVMCLCLAAFAFLDAFGNITDYGSNFAFVQHVLSMDTTFPGNALMYRSITNPALWTAGYWLIILGEALTCLLYLVAAWSLWRARKASAQDFNDAKKFGRHCRHDGLPDLVFRLHGRGRRMVRHVAVGHLERPAEGVHVLHDHACRPDFRHPA